jgi:hypothetical protein
MNFHLTFAVAALTIVLIIVAKELVHPGAALLLAMGGVLFSAFKLKLFAKN